MTTRDGSEFWIACGWLLVMLWVIA